MNICFQMSLNHRKHQVAYKKKGKWQLWSHAQQWGSEQVPLGKIEEKLKKPLINEKYNRVRSETPQLESCNVN